MHVEEAGNPAGAPMLLLHGFLSSNAQWHLNREALGEHYRLLMVELVGHGRSDAPDDAAAYTLDRLIEHIESIRENTGVERWWVCGQSLGGAIAIQYCLAMPDRVQGLIFTNSRAAFGIKREGVSAENGKPPPLTTTRDLGVHPINASRLDDEIKQLLVEAADAMPIHAVRHFLRRRHTWKSTDRMHELAIPVLLVQGRWESAFRPFAEEAKTLIERLEVVEIEGGHAINAEQPHAFNEAVVDFISRHS